MAETGVFKSPSGYLRLDIPAGGIPRERHDAKVAAGELTPVADDAVVEVVEVYGLDRDGKELTCTRLVEAAPPTMGNAPRRRGRPPKSAFADDSVVADDESTDGEGETE